MGREVRRADSHSRGDIVIFSSIPVAGAWLIDIEQRMDQRGFFARTVCSDEFARHGISARFVQQSVSWNPFEGTLRGMHYQAAPFEEDKLVRVTRGAVFDVIADLRPDSQTCGKWYGVELSADNHRQLYVPKGFAHGFQTLQADTEVLYEMTEPFQPDASRGIRWNDLTLGIVWPKRVDVSDPTRISIVDAALPFWKP